MDFTSAGSGYVDCGLLATDMGIGGANDKTMMCWANCNNFLAGESGMIFNIGDSNTTNAGFGIRTRGSNNDWRADFWNNFIDFSVTSLNTWVHFALTYDGTTARVYTNGAADGSSVITLNTQDDYGLYISRWILGGGDEFFDGAIADVRVYSRELSIEEIQTIYEARGKDSVVDSLEGRWKLNDLSIGTSMSSLFVDSTETNGDPVSSIAVTIPSNTDGDLLVAAIAPGGTGVSAANVTTPSGWTFVTSVDTDSAPSWPSLWIYEREASSDSGTYTFNIDQTCTICAQMYCYQNVTTTNDNSGTNNGTGTAAQCPSVNVSSGGGAYLTLRFAVSDGGALSIGSYPFGVNDREFTEFTAGVGNGCGLICADNIRSPVTSTGTKDFSMASEQWCAATVVYKAEPSVKDVSGSSAHPHNADVQNTVTRTETELRI